MGRKRRMKRVSHRRAARRFKYFAWSMRDVDNIILKSVRLFPIFFRRPELNVDFTYLAAAVGSSGLPQAGLAAKDGAFAEWRVRRIPAHVYSGLLR